MWGDRQMKSFLTLSILDCEVAVIEPDPTAFDPLKLYDIFRRYLEHEDNTHQFAADMVFDDSRFSLCELRHIARQDCR